MRASTFKLSLLATSILLTACGGGGGGSSSGSGTTPTTLSTSGTVVDGYYAGSTVTLDTNDNGVCEAGEPTATTDAKGHYDFGAGSGQHKVCATGGVDQTTGQPLAGQFTAPAGASVVNPFTTLVVNIAKSSGQSPADVAAKLATNLGLGTTDLLSTDPVAAAASNPAVLQKISAIETLVTQTTNLLLAASGDSSASASTTAAVFNSVLASVASALFSSSTPVTDLGNTAFISSVVTQATQDAQKNPALTSDASLSGLSSLAPASVAAFATPALSAITSAVANSSAASLLTQGSSNPSAAGQTNSALSNTVAALAPLLTTTAASQGLTTTQLTTIANAAIVTSGGLPSAAPAATTLAAVTNNTPAAVSSSLPASTASALGAANVANNTAAITGIAINCAPNCGSGASSLVSNSAYVAKLTSTGALNDVTINLGNIKGNAVQPLLVTPTGLTAATASTLATTNTSYPVTAGTEYQGSLLIKVAPLAGGSQNLSFTINNVVLYQSVANGATVVTGFIPSSATLSATGTTTAGVSGSATLNATALSSLVSFNGATSSISLNIANLLNQLGQSSSVLKQAAGLDGTVKGQYQINASFSMLQISQNASPTNNFSVLMTFN